VLLMWLNNIYIHINTQELFIILFSSNANRCHQLSDIALAVGLKLFTFGTIGLVEPVWFMVTYNSFEMYVFACWTSGT